MLAANSVTQSSSNVFLKHRNTSYMQIKNIYWQSLLDVIFIFKFFIEKYVQQSYNYIC